MKYIYIALTILVFYLFALVFSAFPAYSQTQIATALNVAQAYNVVDTTAWFTITAGNYSLAFASTDTLDVQIVCDYRFSSASTTTFASYIVKDSTGGTKDAEYFGYILRRGATDNIPGANKVRFRFIAKAGNAWSSNLLDGWLVKN